MTKDTDPIVTLALELGRAAKAHSAADGAWVKAAKHSSEHIRHERECAVLQDRMHALDHMILTAKACSAEGAMAQIMLVASWLDCLAYAGPKLDAEATLQRCDGALASALAALEEVTGRKREDFGGKYHACRKYDMFAEDLSAA